MTVQDCVEIQGCIIEIPDDIDVDAELAILAELNRWHEESARTTYMFD